jgi:hypothetical protein
MYYVYEKLQSGRGIHYKYREKTQLAGSKMGKIPHLLEIHLDGTGSEPLSWHINIRETINRSRWPNCTLIIDLKPNDARGKLLLYEIVEAWGRSQAGWTPVMLHLREVKSEDRRQQNPPSFFRKPKKREVPIFTFVYMNGTVKNGELVGRWTFPARSSTNSVLLWPQTFEYFATEAGKALNLQS